MGAFSAFVELRPLNGEEWKPFSLLVDTAATYSWIPRAALESMGVSPEFRQGFALADSRVVDRDMATVRARINGSERSTIVVFGDDSDSALLGVVTLEEFSLAVDPVNYRLIPVLAMR